MKKVTIVGNNISAMMSALTLAKKGYNVELKSSSKTLGGYFRGIVADGHQFDAGMNLLEFSSHKPFQSSNLDDYNPQVRGDSGRFTSIIKDYMKMFGEYNKIKSPQMYIGNSYYPDLFISNNLKFLTDLPSGAKNIMKGDLGKILASSSPLHASQKHTSTFEEHTLEAVSLANHGKTFHEMFIEPFCKKMTGCSSSAFMGLFHRSLWLPLFYPETLYDALNNKHNLSESEFHYPVIGSFASLVTLMENELKQSGVNIVNKKIERRDVEVNSIWTLDQDALLSLCDTSFLPFDKSDITLAFVLIETKNIKKNFSTMYIPHDNNLPFRITNQSVCSGVEPELTKICLEWGCNQNEYTKLTQDALLQLGVIDKLEDIQKIQITVAKKALMLPTFENFKLSKEKNDMLAEMFPDVKFIGASAPFGATSFNDQIVQSTMKGIYE